MLGVQVSLGLRFFSLSYFFYSFLLSWNSSLLSGGSMTAEETLLTGSRIGTYNRDSWS